MNIDRVHLRVIMMYEFRRGTRISNTVKNICDVFGENAVSIPTCERWFAKFKRGDFNLEDQPRSGRPSGIDDDIVRNLVDANSRISTQEIADRLNVDRSTAFRHLKKLGYSLKLDVWVPHSLTERNKMDRVSTANSLLGRLKTDPFLDRLVTGDEIWIQYDNAERKRTWRQKKNECDQPNQADLQLQKAVLSVWWDCKGVIFYELLPVGETITSDKYCQQLDNLKAAIDEKRPVLAKRKDVVFHHNNVRSHISMQTQRKLRELNWDLLLHPSNSPDISPSDYYLFRSLQNSLNGRKFTSFNDLKNYISSFFDEKPTTFYDRGIRMLPERWRKIIENNGDYLID
ncbi:histone-lysine N-methyltransferase SETMAR-like [Pseudomyrmex gracilis]|uniref:histone-lysine N-methyltransferase SETMAR-like n=1 Tax=Pseudomyrmex gracilis TaxID=219809 RepID=UPI00099538CF|nr:histone-lysine N-methyltransferase SETMAR-like [Pseudomyrmex gracilis]